MIYEALFRSLLYASDLELEMPILEALVNCGKSYRHREHPTFRFLYPRAALAIAAIQSNVSAVKRFARAFIFILRLALFYALLSQKI